MAENNNNKNLRRKSSGLSGISRYWWVLIIVVAMGYLLGKDLALKHNEEDQSNEVSVGQNQRLNLIDSVELLPSDAISFRQLIKYKRDE